MIRRSIVPMFAAVVMFGLMLGARPAMAVDNFCTMGNSPTVNTALGCIPVRVDEFMVWLLPFVFGIAGGISFLLMVYGFIMMTTSSGDPKAVQGAIETIQSAIVGLLVSIFAVFILRLVTVGILKIPGIS